MTKLFFNQVTILGIGLIGASFALALRKNNLCTSIIGYGRSKENLQKAQERGIIDSFELDPASACRESDFILFATPVGTFLDLTKKAASTFKKGALVSDVGSVKGSLVHEMEKIMPEGVTYIGGHPIAGSDRSGIDTSDAKLFIDAPCIITPTSTTQKDSLRIITELWKSLGSQVIHMEPEKHDRLYAAISHLPHIVAYALVNTTADFDKSYLQLSGQGFKDTTRIALSSPELWSDICLLNKHNLLEMMTIFEKNLNSLGQYLRASDSDSLKREFRKARTLREGIGKN